MKKINGVSLFANVGLAETFLSDLGIEIVLANELMKERADFYKHLYPSTEVICGDITDDLVRDEIVNKAIQKDCEFLIATPPCQGMSKHGKQDPNDERNFLIYYAIDAIKRIKPKYVLLENVPKQLTTKINVNGKKILIPAYIKKELRSEYVISKETLFNAADYGVPQSRERCIMRMVRKDIDVHWEEPQKQQPITLQQAIGHLPSLDPLVREEEHRKVFPDFEKKKKAGLQLSKWHTPPKHSWNHVCWMMHTPSGKTAFENDEYYPQNKDGSVIKGRISTYKRFSWDKPANTITQNNGVISSSVCVHPGRYIGVDKQGDAIYSDARVLTIYELLIVSSLPTNWNIPDWANEKLIRNVIGEGVPPLLTKAIVKPLINKIEKMEE